MFPETTDFSQCVVHREGGMFFMGNALVTTIIERIGNQLKEIELHN